ncbi:hypothetical protein RchiOBHm_Chr7g0221361 [Rosa chinensis]|uniref:Uncharacterized protein n=1 Tax=Rosa chinensis TaxID=74649 RepID=A0A2P6PCZ9_ROSCH|nr:hypothetical protein RchiOBHm_Chr7g0221361 [Rosa chinensis]
MASKVSNKFKSRIKVGEENLTSKHRSKCDDKIRQPCPILLNFQYNTMVAVSIYVFFFWTDAKLMEDLNDVYF